ncbi:MAG: ABC transporter ATP-binding protein [Bradymonadaceae bacterium]
MSDRADSEERESSGARADDTVAHTGGDEVVIAARRVSYAYDEVVGLNDVSVDIGPGVTGLLGPNGAGKSTFLKVLSGQLPPDTGAVSIGGEPVWNHPETFRRIGLVPEHDAFYDEMTGREFVTYLTRLQGFDSDAAAEMAGNALGRVGLADDADRPIAGYSKGMRQRVKLAQALAHAPDVLFLDEPLNGTDPVGRRKVIDLVRRFGEEGKTVVVSSHVLEEVEEMTSDILLIDKGRILADGNIYRLREMIDQHPHRISVRCDRPRPFAARLIELEHVVELDFGDDGFELSTERPDDCYSQIVSLAVDEGIELRSMTSPDNDLSAVFRYLVE